MDAKTLLKPLGRYVAVFLAAFLVNTVITSLFFCKSDYLQNQVCWGKKPLLNNLNLICRHVAAVLVGRGTHYGFVFGLLVVIAIFAVSLLIFRSRQGTRGGKIVVLFYFFAMLGTPFLMTFLCGGAPVVRSQFVLPALTGFLGWLDMRLAAECRVGRKQKLQTVALWIVGGICFLGIWSEADTTLTLYYTEEMCYEQDAFLGRSISYGIECVMDGDDLPVVFVGNRYFQGNNATHTGETIGRSFFCHDAEVEPVYYWSTQRIRGFLCTLGANYRSVGINQMELAQERGQSMAVWPAQGSICRYDDMIIIKLGEY